MLEMHQIESYYPEPARIFRKNILREYLQYKILDIVFNTPYAQQLVFMGGTAIRIVHGHDRFSEDLDFDNIQLDKSDFEAMAMLIKQKLELEGYVIDIRTIMKGAFHCYISFSQLLQDFNITGHPET